jgi:AraC-like DNA-binding protein
MPEKTNILILGCGSDVYGTDAALSSPAPQEHTDECLLLFCQAGQVICRFEKTGYIAQAGDVICFFPHTARDFRFGRNHRVAWVRLKAQAQEALRDFFSDSCVRALGKEMQKLEHFLTQMQLEYHARLPYWQESAQAYYTLLFAAMRRVGGSTVSLAAPKAELTKILPALSAMEQASERDETVEYYAKLCGLSTYHFIRTFRRYTSLSPIQYRTKLRIERACELLLGEESVTEIARAVGYADPIHFAKQFKAQIGQTPRAYRKQLKETEETK